MKQGLVCTHTSMSTFIEHFMYVSILNRGNNLPCSYYSHLVTHLAKGSFHHL